MKHAYDMFGSICVLVCALVRVLHTVRTISAKWTELMECSFVMYIVLQVGDGRGQLAADWGGRRTAALRQCHRRQVLRFTYAHTPKSYPNHFNFTSNIVIYHHMTTNIFVFWSSRKLWFLKLNSNVLQMYIL